jgi:hypothetical protein
MNVSERQRARDRAFYLKVRNDPVRWAERKKQVNKARHARRAKRARFA